MRDTCSQSASLLCHSAGFVVSADPFAAVSCRGRLRCTCVLLGLCRAWLLHHLDPRTPGSRLVSFQYRLGIHSSTTGSQHRERFDTDAYYAALSSLDAGSVVMLTELDQADNVRMPTVRCCLGSHVVALISTSICPILTSRRTRALTSVLLANETSTIPIRLASTAESHRVARGGVQRQTVGQHRRCIPFRDCGSGGLSSQNPDERGGKVRWRNRWF